MKVLLVAWSTFLSGEPILKVNRVLWEALHGKKSDSCGLPSAQWMEWSGKWCKLAENMQNDKRNLVTTHTTRVVKMTCWKSKQAPTCKNGKNYMGTKHARSLFFLRWYAYIRTAHYGKVFSSDSVNFSTHLWIHYTLYDTCNTFKTVRLLKMFLKTFFRARIRVFSHCNNMLYDK